MRLDIVFSIIQLITTPATTDDATSAAISGPEPGPSPASPAGLICGLTQPDVDAIMAHYGLGPDPQVLSAALSAPLFCPSYGDLCLVADHLDAEAYVCSIWGALSESQVDTSVYELSISTLPDFIDHICPVDEAACEAVCNPDDVRSCGAKYHDGECHPIAQCDFSLAPELNEIPYFEEILVPVQY